MSIWNKILVGLIGVASLALFYMAARTMKTHQYWRELALKHERKIEQVQEDNQNLAEGAAKPGKPAELGIRQLRLELKKLLLDRRRAWFKCEPKGIKPNREEGTAVMVVTTDQPDPNGIAVNTILYVFEEADVQKKGRYLGEFKVTKADEKQKTVTLASATRLTPLEIDHLAASKRPWELYEVMPRDNHDIFALLSDEEKKAMLPAESLPEYLKDGKPAAKDDAPERVVDGKYVRALRDYQILFTNEHVRRTLMSDRYDAATRDKKLIDDALAMGKEQAEAVKKDVAAAKEDKEKFAGERDAVAKYRGMLEKEFDAVRKTIAQLIESNKAMAGQITKLQFEAARLIDQRTRAMAQSRAGGQ